MVFNMKDLDVLLMKHNLELSAINKFVKLAKVIINLNIVHLYF